jgi:hypothetical protein
MPEWFSLLVLLSGLAIFVASFVYLCAYLKYRRETSGLFRWSPLTGPAGDIDPKKLSQARAFLDELEETRHRNSLSQPDEAARTDNDERQAMFLRVSLRSLLRRN